MKALSYAFILKIELRNQAVFANTRHPDLRSTARTQVLFKHERLRPPAITGALLVSGSMLSLSAYGSDLQPSGKDNAVVTPSEHVTLWQEDFNSLDMKHWNVTTSASGQACRSDGERFNKEVQAYTANTDCASPDHNLCVSEGTAKFVVRRQDANGCAGYAAPYTSARINTKGKRGFHPGLGQQGIRIEARIRMPAQVEGIWPAFWTLGRDLKQGPLIGDDANDWPDVGEIDIAEAGWAWEQGVRTLATLHDSHGNWSNYDGENHRQTSAGSHAIGRNEWHTYAVEWKPDSIQWSLDGVPFSETVDLKSLPNHDFEHEHFILLNFAMGGAGGGTTLAADSFFPSNGTQYTPQQVMEVDYVKVIALNGPRGLSTSFMLARDSDRQSSHAQHLVSRQDRRVGQISLDEVDGVRAPEELLVDHQRGPPEDALRCCALRF